MSTSDFFQCLICNTFFGNLWKAEQHIKRHEHDEKRAEEENRQNLRTAGNVPVRRRGMLPIKKVIFIDCFVRVERNQGHSQSGGSGPKRRKRDVDMQKISAQTDDDVPNERVGGTMRKPRSCRLKAEQKLKQVAALLQLPEESNDVSDGVKEEMEFIEGVMKEPIPFRKGYYNDDEFHPNPVGQHRKSKNTRAKLKVSTAPPSFTSLNESSSSSSSDSSFTEAPSKRKRRKGYSRPVKCDHCPMTLPNQKTLANHITQQHKDKVKVIICPVSFCKSPTLNFYRLLEHLRMHSKAERKELFHSIANPAEKLKLQTNINPDHYHLTKVFHCKLCLSKHESLKELKTHLREAHPGYNLKCPETDCAKEGFQGSVMSLVAHVRLSHPHQLDPFNERLEKKNIQQKQLKCDNKCHSSCDQCQLNTHKEKVHTEKSARNINNVTKDNHILRPFSCPVCKRGFSNKDNLRRHFHLHLENNPYVCDFPNCKRKFNSAYNLRRHKTLHYEKTARHNCPICSVSYRKKETLVNHLRNVHNPNELPGNANSASGLRKRKTRLLPLGSSTILTYTEEEIKALREKQKQASSVIGNLQTNDDKVEESEPVLEVQSKNERKEHSEQIKTEDPDEEIHLVDKILVGEDGTALHIKGEHLSPQKTPSSSRQLSRPTSAPKHQDKLLSRTSRMDINIITDPVFQRLIEEDPSLSTLKLVGIGTRKYAYHTGKSFKCPECDEVFTRAWTLQLHMTSQHKKTIVDEVFAGNEGDPENGQQPKITFMCGVCAYPAKSKEDMAVHFKTHEQVYPWKCLKKGCGRIFPTEKQLDRHVNQIHLASRNFTCKLCSKAFISKRNLNTHEYKVHQRMPDGEQLKKKCPLCPATIALSTYANHIKRHKDQAKGVEPPKCMLCQDTFSCKSALKRHIDCVHLGKPLNKIRNAAAKKKRAAEWFDPLVKKICERQPVTGDGGAQTGSENSALNNTCPDEDRGNNLEGGSGEAEEAILGL